MPNFQYQLWGKLYFFQDSVLYKLLWIQYYFWKCILYGTGFKDLTSFGTLKLSSHIKTLYSFRQIKNGWGFWYRLRILPCAPRTWVELFAWRHGVQCSAASDPCFPAAEAVLEILLMIYPSQTRPPCLVVPQRKPNRN